MALEIIRDKELEEIRGGQPFDLSLYLGMMSIIALLVAVYKVYASSKGKTKIGNDFTFEWS